MARAQKLDHIELRHREEKQINLQSKTAKVSLILDLPGSADALMQGFKSKLRSQIRKPEKEGLTAVIGGMEQADNFYYVFSRNMRYLGTPVYNKHFFRPFLPPSRNQPGFALFLRKTCRLLQAFWSATRIGLRCPGLPRYGVQSVKP